MKKAQRVSENSRPHLSSQVMMPSNDYQESQSIVNEIQKNSFDKRSSEPVQ